MGSESSVSRGNQTADDERVAADVCNHWCVIIGLVGVGCVGEQLEITCEKTYYVTGYLPVLWITCFTVGRTLTKYFLVKLLKSQEQ